MMKYLYPDIPWSTIKMLGFDMDGTLYDEFQFITQVYQPIAKLFCEDDKQLIDVRNKMLMKWMEKGSSYPFIFSEIATEVGIDKQYHESKIKEALTIFRNFKPVIELSDRMKFILDQCKRKYALFLVSDGSSTLQWNKIKALQLEHYFDEQNIFISGDHGKGAEKPSLKALEQLPVFKNDFVKEEVVFIGDRINDRKFAAHAGFYYIDIHNLHVNL